MEPIKLTQYSHGAGCGCKISPKNLEIILKSSLFNIPDPKLLVGYESRDDAAVYDIGHDQAVISTTDFFMPIVDDAFDFGRIAATNAISDIYAMGGTPIMAIAILGWPVNKLPLEVAHQVIEGGRAVCQAAGIPLAGGHSIDSPEPIFGLAVSGIIHKHKIKRNDTALCGDILFLTKPLGVGILSTAQKKGLLKAEDEKIMIETMCTLNKVGEELARVEGVHAMTDVTGFGLLGHLLEMARGSNFSARIDFHQLALLPNVQYYLDAGAFPGGTTRNWDSYGLDVEIDMDKVTMEASMTYEHARLVLADPQTSGGLLISVDPAVQQIVIAILQKNGLYSTSIGEIIESSAKKIYVN